MVVEVETQILEVLQQKVVVVVQVVDGKPQVGPLEVLLRQHQDLQPKVMKLIQVRQEQ